MPESKICCRCVHTKTISEFGKNVRAKDGLDFYCRECVRSISKQRRRENQKKSKVKLEGLKTCSRCKRNLEVTQFHLDRGRFDGRQPSCVDCCAEMQRIRAKRRTESYQPAVGYKRCPTCKLTLSVAAFGIEKGRIDGLAHTCKACQSKRYQAIRMEVFEHYCKGVPFCFCCKETRLEFLSIDHINGGGNKHRKLLKEGAIHRHLKRNGFPEGYRVLYHNCNQSLGHYGYCPHQKEMQ